MTATDTTPSSPISQPHGTPAFAEGGARSGHGAGFSHEAAAALAADLSRAIGGEVRFADGDRALYATDASNYRQVPIGVVIPRTLDDVIAAMEVCRAHGAPFLSRGGGTSLAGQSCNIAVLVDFSKYLNRLLSLDPAARLAKVEPGTILDDLREAAEKHHLTFAPDPSTHDHNTLGGMLGNNSCGTHSVMGGRTADNVRALDILTYDGLRLTVGPTGPEELSAIIAAGGRRGDIYRRLDDLQRRYGELIRQRYPRIPRRVSGYNLDNLLPENGFHVARALVGSQGTCVTILGATLELVPSPPHRALAVLGFADIFAAGDAAAFVRGYGPIALEALDDLLIDFMRNKHEDMSQVAALPEGRGWLIAEFGGASAEEAAEKAEALRRAFARRKNPPHIQICRSPQEQQRIWKVREAGLGSTAFVPHHPDMWEGRIPRCRPTRSAPTAATSKSSFTNTATTRPSTAILAMAASTAGSISVCAPARVCASGAALWTRRPISSCPMAARSRASTATASRAPSFCPRCSARNWSRLFASSGRSGTGKGG